MLGDQSKEAGRVQAEAEFGGVTRRGAGWGHERCRQLVQTALGQGWTAPARGEQPLRGHMLFTPGSCGGRQQRRKARAAQPPLQRRPLLHQRRAVADQVGQVAVQQHAGAQAAPLLAVDDAVGVEAHL